MQTQWRSGAMGNVTGFDYVALESVFRILNVADDRRPQLFDELRVMELAALKKINHKAKA